MVPAGDPRAGEGRGAVSPHLVREQLARILRSRRFVEAPTLTDCCNTWSSRPCKATLAS